MSGGGVVDDVRYDQEDLKHCRVVRAIEGNIQEIYKLVCEVVRLFWVICYICVRSYLA